MLLPMTVKLIKEGNLSKRGRKCRIFEEGGRADEVHFYGTSSFYLIYRIKTLFLK